MQSVDPAAAVRAADDAVGLAGGLGLDRFAASGVEQNDRALPTRGVHKNRRADTILPKELVRNQTRDQALGLTRASSCRSVPQPREQTVQAQAF